MTDKPHLKIVGGSLPGRGAPTGGSGGEGMEARIAKLEADVGDLRSDMKEVKADLKQLGRDVAKQIGRAHV